MSSFAGETTFRPGESKPIIFAFTGASSVSSVSTEIYKNGSDVSAGATGTTPSTVLSGSTSSSGVTVTTKVITIPLTGYFGTSLRLVIQATVDGQILRPWILINVPDELLSK